jgi:hypothetical protein
LFRSIGLPELLVIAVVFGLVYWPWAKIFAKAGYSRWWCIPANIPLVNFVVLFWFAFADWPTLKRLRENTPGSQIVAPPLT